MNAISTSDRITYDRLFGAGGAIEAAMADATHPSEYVIGGCRHGLTREIESPGMFTLGSLFRITKRTVTDIGHKRVLDLRWGGRKQRDGISFLPSLWSEETQDALGSVGDVLTIPYLQRAASYLGVNGENGVTAIRVEPATMPGFYLLTIEYVEASEEGQHNETRCDRYLVSPATVIFQMGDAQARPDIAVPAGGRQIIPLGK